MSIGLLLHYEQRFFPLTVSFRLTRRTSKTTRLQVYTEVIPLHHDLGSYFEGTIVVNQWVIYLFMFMVQFVLTMPTAHEKTAHKP